MQGHTLLLIGLLSVSINTVAEVYRWVDKDGKVHYTDRKPAANAENITKDVNKQNLDSSSREIARINQMHREDEDAARIEQHKHEQARAQAMQAPCAAAQTRLRKMKGRVVFVDKAGKAVTVTEKERQEKVAELERYISNNCTS
jgi:hypothetical protein